MRKGTIDCSNAFADRRRKNNILAFVLLSSYVTVDDCTAGAGICFNYRDLLLSFLAAGGVRFRTDTQC